MNMHSRKPANCIVLLSLLISLGQVALCPAQEGSIDTTFSSPKLTGMIGRIFVQADGKILYTQVRPSLTGHTLARLNPDGAPDAGFQTNGAGGLVITPPINIGTIVMPGSTNYAEINAIAEQKDGKIWIGGNFSHYNGVARRGLARLNADGSLDTTFSDIVGYGSGVTGLLIAPDGKIYLSGDYTTLNGISRKFKVMRLNANATVDTTFKEPNTTIYANVLQMSLESDGKLLVSAAYASGTTPTYQLYRLNIDGGIDTTFQNGAGTTYASGTIFNHALLADGRILASGGAGTYNGSTVNPTLFRLNADGKFDPSFQVDIKNGNFLVTIGGSLALHDGRAYVRGTFLTVNGVSRPTLARLKNDGSVDTTFAPPSYYAVPAMTLQSDGKLLVGTLTLGATGVIPGLFRLNAKLQADPPPVVTEGPRITMARHTKSFTISWDGTGILQSSDKLGGTWTDVPSSNNQYQVNASTGLRFYRVAKP